MSWLHRLKALYFCIGGSRFLHRRFGRRLNRKRAIDMDFPWASGKDASEASNLRPLQNDLRKLDGIQGYERRLRSRIRLDSNLRQLRMCRVRGVGSHVVVEYRVQAD